MLDNDNAPSKKNMTCHNVGFPTAPSLLAFLAFYEFKTV
jgi:hypothetical protein